MRLEIRGRNDVDFQLGDQLGTVLNEARYELRERVSTGRFAGTVPTPDARRRPRQVLLRLWYRAGKLSGQATAQIRTEPVYFALSSYVELKSSH